MATGHSSKPLYIAVVTHDADSGEIEQQKVIDHNDKNDRVWLSKHCFWAFRNKKAVTTISVPTKDAEAPEWVNVD